MLTNRLSPPFPKAGLVFCSRVGHACESAETSIVSLHNQFILRVGLSTQMVFDCGGSVPGCRVKYLFRVQGEAWPE